MEFKKQNKWANGKRERDRQRQKQTKKQILNYREQTDGCQKEGGWGGWVKQVIGIKEDTCDEHQVMYGSVESLYCIPEINLTLYVN